MNPCGFSKQKTELAWMLNNTGFTAEWNKFANQKLFIDEKPPQLPYHSHFYLLRSK